ncbi:hypothetical protein H5410_017108 [Solanum commersonii]|uniref:Uncharacterized protein n=1 Tax=Solanum commersonii TaxID=4109 RepID=A0A9J5ZZC7_SOLCO|nr:hypothetical protein H5410_017108 [Solanum commersonii]
MAMKNVTADSFRLPLHEIVYLVEKTSVVHTESSDYSCKSASICYGLINSDSRDIKHINREKKNFLSIIFLKYLTIILYDNLKIRYGDIEETMGYNNAFSRD